MTPTPKKSDRARLLADWFEAIDLAYEATPAESEAVRRHEQQIEVRAAALIEAAKGAIR